MSVLGPEVVEQFTLTPKQREANRLLASDARHIMLFGGARSGKTFVLVRAIILRALKEGGSRHVILRYRFNHVKASIWYDTFPKVMKLCFPQLVKGVHYNENKSDWFIKFENGSEVWFGGLDDKDRSEKILGQEYATIYLNEVSQISYHSILMARTRLAQKTGLSLKMYYDCNPPTKGHWSYRNFIQKVDPDSKEELNNAAVYAALVLNPKDNSDNLLAATLEELQNLPRRQRLRFYEGEFQADNDNALWTYELINSTRKNRIDIGDLGRVVISVDPSGTRGSEDYRSDKIGIVVVGEGSDGDYYVIEDASMRAGPAKWGKAVVDLYYKYDADLVIGEINYGGALVEHVIITADNSVPYKEVCATKGKHIRAEPISYLFHKSASKQVGGAHLVGEHKELEDQLVEMTTVGYMGSKSPDNADAMIWGLTELSQGRQVFIPTLVTSRANC